MATRGVVSVGSCRARLNLGGLCGQMGEFLEGSGVAKEAGDIARDLRSLSLRGAASNLEGSMILASISDTRGHKGRSKGESQGLLERARECFEMAVESHGSLGAWKETRESEVLLAKCIEIIATNQTKTRSQTTRLGRDLFPFVEALPKGRLSYPLQATEKMEQMRYLAHVRRSVSSSAVLHLPSLSLPLPLSLS